MNYVKIKKRVASWDLPGTLMALVKEFAVPAAIAFLAVLAGTTSSGFAELQKAFLGFFAIAWFTGQFVRVRRDRQRRSEAMSAESKLLALTQKLEEQTTKIVGYATGGDNKARVDPMYLLDGDRIVIMVYNDGEFPLHDVVLHAHDLADDDSAIRQDITFSDRAAPQNLLRWSCAALQPRQSFRALSIPLSGRAAGNFLIYLRARNHGVVIEVAMSRAGGVRLAYQRTGGTSGWEVIAHQGFPGYDPANTRAIFSIDSASWSPPSGWQYW